MRPLFAGARSGDFLLSKKYAASGPAKGLRVGIASVGGFGRLNGGQDFSGGLAEAQPWVAGLDALGLQGDFIAVF